MARYVELIGVPGVGKTTVFKEVERLWENGCRWVPETHIEPTKDVKCDRRPYRYHVRTYARYLWSRCRGAPRWANRAVLNPAVYEEACQEFVNREKALVDMCWDNISRRIPSVNGDDHRLFYLQYLYKLFGRIQFIAAHSTTKTILTDEGLVHNLGIMLNPDDSYEKRDRDIRHIIRHAPMPAAVLFLQARGAATVERLLKRGHRIKIHERLTEKQLLTVVENGLLLKEEVISILEEAGIHTYRVDASPRPEFIGNTIIELLNRISETNTLADPAPSNET